MILRVSTAVRIPVYLLDGAGAAVTGLLAEDFAGEGGNVTIVTAAGDAALFNLSDDVNLFEVDSSLAPGLYHILLGVDETAVVGPLQVVVLPAAAAFEPQVLLLQVDDQASNASLAAKIASNSWRIFTSGGDANRLVVYDDDGTTPLVKFDLKTAAGAPTTTSPLQRIKV